MNMLMFESRFGFQPEEQLPLHMACSRPSGAVEIVKTLLKASGKDAKVTSDKVSKIFEICVNKRIEELKNFPWFSQKLDRKIIRIAPKTVTPEENGVTKCSNIIDENRWPGL